MAVEGKGCTRGAPESGGPAPGDASPRAPRCPGWRSQRTGDLRVPRGGAQASGSGSRATLGVWVGRKRGIPCVAVWRPWSSAGSTEPRRRSLCWVTVTVKLGAPLGSPSPVPLSSLLTLSRAEGWGCGLAPPGLSGMESMALLSPRGLEWDLECRRPPLVRPHRLVA